MAQPGNTAITHCVTGSRRNLLRAGANRNNSNLFDGVSVAPFIVGTTYMLGVNMYGT